MCVGVNLSGGAAGGAVGRGEGAAADLVAAPLGALRAFSHHGISVVSFG